MTTQAARNADILQRLLRGETLEVIAKAHGISRERVRQILRKIAADAKTTEDERSLQRPLEREEREEVTLRRRDVVATCAICGGGICVEERPSLGFGWVFRHYRPDLSLQFDDYITTGAARTPAEIADRLTARIAARHGIDWPPQEGTPCLTDRSTTSPGSSC